jgi:hypothetical protein
MKNHYEVKICDGWMLYVFQKDENITLRLIQNVNPKKIYKCLDDTVTQFGCNIEDWDWSEDDYEVELKDENNVLLRCYTATSNGNGCIVWSFST